jgi:hypothetical protein
VLSVVAHTIIFLRAILIEEKDYWTTATVAVETASFPASKKTA